MSDVSIIQNASLNLKKVGPPRGVLVLVGAFLGLLLGMLQAVVRDRPATTSTVYGDGSRVGSVRQGPQQSDRGPQQSDRGQQQSDDWQQSDSQHKVVDTEPEEMLVGGTHTSGSQKNGAQPTGANAPR